MNNEIAIQRDNGNKGQAPALRRDLDPFRIMRDLLRWEPFTDAAPLWSRLEGSAFAPSFDVKETKEGFTFSADLPGVAEKDLQVQLTGNRLSISGKRESEKVEQGQTYYTAERSFGSFMRSFTLPEGVDGDRVHAELKHGVLEVTIPKLPEAKSKKINVLSK
jgi:HSP20 family protein